MDVTNTTMSLSRHRHLLTLGFRNAFCPGEDGFGNYDDDTCNTYERWRDAAEPYRKCQEVGCEEAERSNFNAFRGSRWVAFLLFFFSQSFSNLPFLPLAESLSQDNTEQYFLRSKYP